MKYYLPNRVKYEKSQRDDSYSQKDFLQWISLIKVAWEKLKVCLKSNMLE